MTTPPERTNKLTPLWKGHFRVKRVPNPYQVVYEDGSAWRMIHVNHAKPAKLTAPDLPLPTPAPEPPRPALGYLPRSLQRPRSHPPPPPLQAAALAGGASPPPTASVPTPPAASPPASERLPARSRQPIEIRHHLRGSPRILRMRYSLPPPPQPIRIQNLSLGHGGLQG